MTSAVFSCTAQSANNYLFCLLCSYSHQRVPNFEEQFFGSDANLQHAQGFVQLESVYFTAYNFSA